MDESIVNKIIYGKNVYTRFQFPCLSQGYKNCNFDLFLNITAAIKSGFERHGVFEKNISKMKTTLPTSLFSSD